MSIEGLNLKTTHPTRGINKSLIMLVKLFSPNLYPANDDETTRITEEWLERLFAKFQNFKEEQDRSRGECLEMVETMREMIPNKFLFEAWEFASTTPEWSINWLGLSSLWRRVIMIPSTAICEKDLSKQNLIKSHLHTSLKLETLDALTRNSCANILVENINWNAVMLVWGKKKDRKIHPLL
jgi:hypothetical protein